VGTLRWTVAAALLGGNFSSALSI